MRWLPFALVAACGRFDFGILDGGSSDSDGGATGDGPALPAAVCGHLRVPATNVPVDADLAVATTQDGYVAIWVDATKRSETIAAHIAGNGTLLAQHTLTGIPMTNGVLGGAVDVGTGIAINRENDLSTEIDLVPYDVSAAMYASGGGPALTGRDGIATDATVSHHVFISASNTELDLQYVSTSGVTGTINFYDTGNPITGLAATNGPDHVHAVWTNDIGGGMSRCTACDIKYMPSWPIMGSQAVLSDDCYNVRNDSGPLPPDGMIIVWTTKAGTVEARYIVSTGDHSGQVSPHGRAPKVRYNGTTAWIMWIETPMPGHDELRIAIFDLATGAITPTALPDWLSSGDEAFELVLASNHVVAAVLSNGALDFLTLCP